MSGWSLHRTTEALDGDVTWHVIRNDLTFSACGHSQERLRRWGGWGLVRVSCFPCRVAAGDLRPRDLRATCSVEDDPSWRSNVAHVATMMIEISGMRGRVSRHDGLAPACQKRLALGMVRPGHGPVTCLACLALGRPS